MSVQKKIVMLYAGDGTEHPDDGLDLQRLVEVLRARGGMVEEQVLGSTPNALLDQLQAGALPIVFRDGLRDSR